MSETLSITIPNGVGHVQTYSDGSIKVWFPLGLLPDYRDLSEQFIHLGVGLMLRGREQHVLLSLAASRTATGEDA